MNITAFLFILVINWGFKNDQECLKRTTNTFMIEEYKKILGEKCGSEVGQHWQQQGCLHMLKFIKMRKCMHFIGHKSYPHTYKRNGFIAAKLWKIDHFYFMKILKTGRSNHHWKH